MPSVPENEMDTENLGATSSSGGEKREFSPRDDPTVKGGGIKRGQVLGRGFGGVPSLFLKKTLWPLTRSARWGSVLSLFSTSVKKSESLRWVNSGVGFC